MKKAKKHYENLIIYIIIVLTLLIVFGVVLEQNLLMLITLIISKITAHNATPKIRVSPVSQENDALSKYSLINGPVVYPKSYCLLLSIYILLRRSK